MNGETVVKRTQFLTIHFCFYLQNEISLEQNSMTISGLKEKIKQLDMEIEKRDIQNKKVCVFSIGAFAVSEINEC